jgi:hypothetical protein
MIRCWHWPGQLLKIIKVETKYKWKPKERMIGPMAIFKSGVMLAGYNPTGFV